MTYLANRERTGITPYEMQQCSVCSLLVENTRLQDKHCATCDGSMQPEKIRCNRCHPACRYCNNPTCDACTVRCTTECQDENLTTYTHPCCRACNQADMKCASCQSRVCGNCSVSRYVVDGDTESLCSMCALVHLVYYGSGQAAGIIMLSVAIPLN
jgi:hypothetical protein